MADALRKALAKQPGHVLFLDGGLATHLEALGQNIKDSLWSAKLLITNPSIISQAHYDYLVHGCNILITSSYQASIKGFTSPPYSLTVQQAVDKMSQSVTLAYKAIERYKKDKSIANKTDTLLIAASIGCYGAGLADGSEYTGYYGEHTTMDDLRAYHSVKMHASMKVNKTNKIAIANQAEMVLACETIPNVMEVRVLTELLNEYKYYGWITMTCRNQYQLSSNEYVQQAIDTIIQYNTGNYVVGIGFNCTHPRYIDDLLQSTRQYLTDRKQEYVLIVYPNSGEEWQNETHSWKPNTTMSDEQFARLALKWYQSGANIIGGCCRTTPSTIQAIKSTILNYVQSKSMQKSKL